MKMRSHDVRISMQAVCVAAGETSMMAQQDLIWVRVGRVWDMQVEKRPWSLS